MSLFKNLKKLFENPDKKRLVENCAIVIIIGVIVIIAGSTLFGSAKKESAPKVQENINVETAGKSISNEEKADLEKKVEDILTQISGAGKVNVAITFYSGKEMVPAYNTKKSENATEEKDKEGGSRSIKQSSDEDQVVYEEQQGGGKKPLIVKELQPAVKGVVVVAEGASDPQVKESLCRAVQVLLEVPVHKIQVFQKSK